MTTWTWTGGGNNQWNNPANWAPNGTPMPGDTLVMNGGTINISHAIENFQLIGGLNQINLNGGDILTINSGIYGTATSPDNSAVSINVNAPGAIVSGTFNQALEPASINFMPNTSMIFTGTYDDGGSGFGGGLNITGSGTLINDGTITATRAEIDSNVLGLGTIKFTATHDSELGDAKVSGASGGGLTYDLSFYSNTTIEHPNTFMSKLDMDDGSFLTLAGLAATSYDFKNDLLTLYQRNRPVYHLNVTDRSNDGQPLYVASSTGGVTVGVWPQPLGSPPLSNILPQHTTGV